jgi:hypothetical protein
MVANRLDVHCQLDRCAEPAAAVLGSQALCLNHFVAQCYQQLDELDPRTRRIPNGAIELAKRMSEVDEFSHAALRVCFTEQNLENLERGRLLDILLWAGELYALLHEPGAHLVNARDAKVPGHRDPHFATKA